MKKIGIVVIGRNEALNIERCLLSVGNSCLSKVYVDSASADGSPDIARKTGWSVVELKNDRHLSASLARNKGFEYLMRGQPDIFYVQFIDGDCELASRWLQKAVTVLEKEKDAAIIFGKRREKKVDSVFKRNFETEWSRPWEPSEGEVQECGGDFLIRAAAFKEINGFIPDLKGGEEPELCFRLRQKGWKILKINENMVVHNAPKTHLKQWWLRQLRYGHACGQVFFCIVKKKTPPIKKRSRRSCFGDFLCRCLFFSWLYPLLAAASC